MAAFINLKFPLRSFRRGFYEGNDTTIAAVTEDIKTLLLTKKGERVINRSLGTNLPVFSGILFEQQSKENIRAKVEAEIKDALAKWLPHVILTEIEVITDDDINGGLALNYILIRMKYTLLGSPGINEDIQIKINKQQ